MAASLEENQPPSDQDNIFKKVRREIEELFDHLIDKLNERREFLLKQVNKWEKEFNRTRASCVQSLQEIRRERDEMEECLSKLKLNQTMTTLENGIVEINKEINERKKFIHYPQILFLYDRKFFDLEISNFGYLSRETGDISVRKNTQPSQPMKAFGTFGKRQGEFYYPSGIQIDDEGQRILIGDSFNSRVQVWSMEGDHLTEFGEGTLHYPWGIVLRDKFVYISDYTGSFLSKWSFDEFSFVKKSNTIKGSKPGMLKHPSGLDSDEDEIFVVEGGNNRISVFDFNLKFKRVMAECAINNSTCLRVRNSTVYIVELTGCIKLFSKSGQLLKTIEELTSLSKEICNFTLDSKFNFLVTVSDKNSLYILSINGELLHSICFTEFYLSHRDRSQQGGEGRS